MPLERVLCLSARSQTITLAKVTDETVYGTPNADRGDEAHFLVIAKMDENQVLSFITGVDNSLPLAVIEWSFTNSVDGAYRFILFIPDFYNGGATYTKEIQEDGIITTYADIIWHPGSAKFYKAIETSFTAIEPSVTVGWEAYWQPDPDFTTQVSNNKVPSHIHDDIIPFRFEDCLMEQIDEVNDDILCGVCAKWEDLFTTLSMQLLLDGANSNNWQDKQTRSEVILVEANKKFCC